MSVRTRFAPSPTGSLHVGGARTALYCLLYARQHEGRFLLRIEDTDRARSTDEATLGILRDLEWLGLGWDEGPEKDGEVGPYFQSKRLPLYDRYVEELLASGRAYRAWETPEELSALREASQAATGGFRYRGGPVDPDLEAAYLAEGRPHVVRLRAPSEPITVHDRVLGDVEMPAEDFEDLVLRKADGFPTYHFAVVVDDHHMRVSQVLRGQEHLMNTPKHLAIYAALGWEAPEFGHLPILFNPGGGKMSKRDKARTARAAAREAQKASGATSWDWLAAATDLTVEEVTDFMKKGNDQVATANAIARVLQIRLPLIEVMDFRKGGYLPEALLNYLALLGWSPGDDREVMTLEEMTRDFSLERVNRTAARFDPDKLAWMNGEYIRSCSIDSLLEHLALWLEVVDSPLDALTASQHRALLEMYQPRIATLVDLELQARFFWERPTTWDEKSCKRHLLKGGGVERLADLRALFAGPELTWTLEGLTTGLEAWAAERELGLGKVAQPLRVALTGTGVSPGIYETLAFFDREEVLARIEACLEFVVGLG